MVVKSADTGISVGLTRGAALRIGIAGLPFGSFPISTETPLLLRTDVFADQVQIRESE
jgi:hypothetical protein